MNDRITSDEVANQLAKAIQLMLEWAKQELLAVHQPDRIKVKSDREALREQITQISDRLLKAKEVADTLQVSRSQVYRLMQLGEIPTIKVGSAVRVRGSDLEEFIKQNKSS